MVPGKHNVPFLFGKWTDALGGVKSMEKLKATCFPVVFNKQRVGGDVCSPLVERKCSTPGKIVGSWLFGLVGLLGVWLVCLFVCLFVGWLVGWFLDCLFDLVCLFVCLFVGLLVCWFVVLPFQ